MIEADFLDNLRVVFHIDNSERWKMVLGNVKNLLNEISSNDIKIEVLANGNAVSEYDKSSKESDKLNLMEDLSKNDVKFVACNNSLNSLKLSKEGLLDFVEIVPAGVLELIEKQDEGYAYIKP